MFQLRPIESLDDPALLPYRTLRRSVEHTQLGIFVAEGEKVVRRLLEDERFGVLSVLLETDRVEAYTGLIGTRPEITEVFVADKRVLKELIGFTLNQGALAVGRIPPPTTLEVALAASPRPWLLVAADELSNADNVGSLIRNSAAFGAHALIIGETCSPAWLRRTVRTSMGTIFQIPIIETTCLAETLRGLRRTGVHVVAAHPHVDGRTLTQASMTGDCCLVMGSEGTGIRPEVLEVCDEAVAIPMPPTVDSLNVTAATSVFLYEACRQRGMM